MNRFFITFTSAIILTLTSFHTTMAQKKITQTAGHDALGEFAPEFAKVNDDILFGEVWNRPDCHPTIAA